MEQEKGSTEASAGSVDRGLLFLLGMLGPQLFVTAILWTGCAAAHAQTVIGSPGAGFQSWTAANLNNNGAPFWDAPTRSVGAYSGNPDSKNVGFCLTGGGDCIGIGTHAAAPGALPFWGMAYDAAADSGGAFDPKVYFRRSHGDHELRATLELQFSTVPAEINEFGWFETDAHGSIVGARHLLFHGGGVPPGSATPDPVGKSVTFKPTEYFGYYFSDVSEGGCLAYTLSGFNDQPACGGHNVVVFAAHPGDPRTTHWIAAEDPPGCDDADCNLTLVRIAPVGK